MIFKIMSASGEVSEVLYTAIQASMVYLLDQELKNVDWYMLGTYLKFSQSELKDIEQDQPTTARRRVVMLDKWLRKEVEPSWIIIIAALERMSENNLASRLKKKYLRQQGERTDPTTTTRSDASARASEKVLKVDRRDSVARELERLKGNYLRLRYSAEVALKVVDPSSRELKRFSQSYCNRVVSTIEELFDCVSELCFLDYALLECIVSYFFKEAKAIVNKDLDDYIQQLNNFKSSTTLKEFMENIESAQESNEGLCTVTLRLVGGWLNKNIDDLDRLLKEIFQDKASILTHLKIVRGSVKITYLVPQSEINSLITLARALPILLEFGVCELLIGQTVIVKDETSFFSFEHSLVDAVIYNQIKLLKFLLDIKTDPNAVDRFSPLAETALYCGSNYGRDEAVKLLLKAGANPNLAIADGVTPLCIAIQNRRSAIVRMLLQADADPNVQRKSDGTTPLYVAAENGFTEMVSILLEAKANPNLQVDYGATALFVAAQNGHTSTVRALLRAKANSNIHKDNGVTPLFMAARYNHFEVAKLLLQANANPNIPKDNGTTPLYMAAQDGRSDIVQILVQANADTNLPKNDGTTPIYMASQFGHTETVKILLRANGDPNLQRNDGVSPLYIAVYLGYTDLVGILLHANANPDLQANSGITPLLVAAQNALCSDIVYILLIAKANPNLSNKIGITPIFMASLLGHTNVVNILLHANANPNFQTTDGISPLFMASQFGHSDVVNVLLKFKANPNLQRKDGASPLYQATFKGYLDIVSSLLKANTNPNIQTDDRSTPLYMAAQAGRSDIVDILLKANANPNLQNSEGATPLCIASQEEHKDTVRLLLNAKADPNVRTKDDVTPLMSACLRRCPVVVDLLLQNGADPNLRQSKGTTALMLASYAGCLESVELLLLFGADTSIVGPKDSTALSMAVSSGHDDIADLIRAKQLSQSPDITSPTTTHTGETTDTQPASSTLTSEKIDNKTMALLNKAIEDMLVAKAKTIISTQDKLLDKNLPEKPPRMHAVK